MLPGTWAPDRCNFKLRRYRQGDSVLWNLRGVGSGHEFQVLVVVELVRGNISGIWIFRSTDHHASARFLDVRIVWVGRHKLNGRRLAMNRTRSPFLISSPDRYCRFTGISGGRSWCCRIRTWRVPCLRGRSRRWSGRLVLAAGNRPDWKRAEWLLRT